ncbi:hypothetical protein HY572_03745 [Candidatus Micrarchaeota archaeon]|nr:hypothetical protein [Candidatus Micrarchaeota archaeon]
MISDPYFDSHRVRDESGFSAGSRAGNFRAIALLFVMLFLLFVQADVILFAVAFLVFVFTYNPTRVRLGDQAVNDTHGLI